MKLDLNKWASLRENLSLEFSTIGISNQSPQLQRLAGNLHFACSKFGYYTFQKLNNKGADQSARMRWWSAPVLYAYSKRQVFLRRGPFTRVIESMKLDITTIRIYFWKQETSGQLGIDNDTKLVYDFLPLCI